MSVGTDEHNERGRARWLVALLMALAVGLGLAVGYLSDGHPLTLAVALGEVFIWIGALLVAAVLWWRRRRPRSALVLLGLTAALLLPLRLPLAPAAATTRAQDYDDLDELEALRRCVDAQPAPRQLEIMAWNTRGLASDGAARQRARALAGADVLVLTEVETGLPVNSMADELGGEARFASAIRGRGTGLVVLGGGQMAQCNGRSMWTFELPTLEERRRAIAVLVIAHRTPILAVHLDRPATLEQGMRWPALLEASSQKLATIARALGPRTVIVGDTNTDARFNRFYATLAAAGVQAAPTRPTWPARLFGRRMFPMFALDRILVGEGWEFDSFSNERPDLRSDHMAIRGLLKAR